MYNIKPPIRVEPKEVYQNFINNNLCIICGKNNSGKSFILKKLYRELGNKTSFLGPNRYQNFNTLAIVAGKRNKYQEYLNWLKNFNENNQNIDNSPWNLNQAIAELGNEKREKLFSIMQSLLNSEIEIKLSDPENEMSQKYISVDNYNISYTSSGFRLIASILTSLLDDDYENFLIDEPELGISPEIQGALAEFLLNKHNRKLYFPHLKKLIIATHSPIFIDRNQISNNYYVKKINDNLIISRIDTFQEINSLQFFLLGNRFETLFLPSLIVLVEGKCDFKFISQITKRKYPEYNISVIQCNSDTRISEYVHLAKNMFGDLNKSPYHNRIITIIDKVHQNGLKNKLIKQGIPERNVIIWENNGIEYYYPKIIMNKIFGNYDNIIINEEIVSANGINKKKNELADEVISYMDGKEEFNEEFKLKLITLIQDLIF